MSVFASLAENLGTRVTAEQMMGVLRRAGCQRPASFVDAGWSDVLIELKRLRVFSKFHPNPMLWSEYPDLHRLVLEYNELIQNLDSPGASSSTQPTKDAVALLSAREEERGSGLFSLESLTDGGYSSDGSSSSGDDVMFVPGAGVGSLLEDSPLVDNSTTIEFIGGDHGDADSFIEFENGDTSEVIIIGNMQNTGDTLLPELPPIPGGGVAAVVQMKCTNCGATRVEHPEFSFEICGGCDHIYCSRCLSRVMTKDGLHQLLCKNGCLIRMIEEVVTEDPGKKAVKPPPNLAKAKSVGKFSRPLRRKSGSERASKIVRRKSPRSKADSEGVVGTEVTKKERRKSPRARTDLEGSSSGIKANRERKKVPKKDERKKSPRERILMRSRSNSVERAPAPLEDLLMREKGSKFNAFLESQRALQLATFYRMSEKLKMVDDELERLIVGAKMYHMFIKDGAEEEIVSVGTEVKKFLGTHFHVPSDVFNGAQAIVLNELDALYSQYCLEQQQQEAGGSQGRASGVPKGFSWRKRGQPSKKKSSSDFEQRVMPDKPRQPVSSSADPCGETEASLDISTLRNSSLISFSNTFEGGAGGGDNCSEKEDLTPLAASPEEHSKSFSWCLRHQLPQLEAFARSVYAAENILCWKAISEYEENPNEQTCCKVYVPHLLLNSPLLVNIQGKELARLRALAKNHSYGALAASHPGLFRQVRRELEKIMKLNLYPLFLARHDTNS